MSSDIYSILASQRIVQNVWMQRNSILIDSVPRCAGCKRALVLVPPELNVSYTIWACRCPNVAGANRCKRIRYNHCYLSITGVLLSIWSVRHMSFQGLCHMVPHGTKCDWHLPWGQPDMPRWCMLCKTFNLPTAFMPSPLCLKHEKKKKQIYKSAKHWTICLSMLRTRLTLTLSSIPLFLSISGCMGDAL